MQKTKNKTIEAGTLLLSEKPFVYTLSSKFRSENCDYCFSSGDLLKCSNCHYVYYCGKNCQKEGWITHKQECKQLKAITPRIIPDAARLLAKLVMKLHKGGDTIKSYYTSIKYRVFKDLESHYTEIKEDKRRMEHFTSLCGVLSQFLDPQLLPNPAELLGIYGRMCINSFNICDEELKSLGTGIYLAASIIDHSCQPNAVATFQGTCLNIRTTETIPNMNWLKISICYIDSLYTSDHRREELQSTYYFWCECPRCNDLEEDKMMKGAACPTKNCKNWIDISSDSCTECASNISDNFKRNYQEISEFTNMHLQNMQLAYLDVCRVLLKKHQGVIHLFNIQHVRVLDLSFEGSIDFNQWDNARKFGMQLLPGYRKYLGGNHPLVGLLCLKLAKILIYQENISTAYRYLKQAYKILKITHGEDSNLFKNEVLRLVQENYPPIAFNDS